MKSIKTYTTCIQDQYTTKLAPINPNHKNTQPARTKIFVKVCCPSKCVLECLARCCLWDLVLALVLILVLALVLLLAGPCPGPCPGPGPGRPGPGPGPGPRCTLEDNTNKDAKDNADIVYCIIVLQVDNIY